VAGNDVTCPQGSGSDVICPEVTWKWLEKAANLHILYISPPTRLSSQE